MVPSESAESGGLDVLFFVTFVGVIFCSRRHEAFTRTRTSAEFTKLIDRLTVIMYSRELQHHSRPQCWDH